MATIPESHVDILKAKSFANLATVMPDGSPQVTPVWVDFDGEHVVINSAKGRQKDRNIERNGHVSVAVADPENPYRYIQIRGEVVSAETDGAVDHINSMAKKYLGADEYPGLTDEETRVVYRIRPDSIQTMG